MFVLDDPFSLMALTKLEYGYNVPVLSQLKPLKLHQLKNRAVFDLKMDKRNGSHDPAVNVYINSWIQDKSASCRPTWRNLYNLFREIGLENIAKEFLGILLECKLYITPISVLVK